MKRIAFILFMLLSASFIALHVVLPQLDTKQEVVQMNNLNRTAEEETEHEIKKDIKEKFHALYNTDFRPYSLIVTLNSSYYLAPLLEGFSSRLYTPPDFL